jgi:hypothetical protein
MRAFYCCALCILVIDAEKIDRLWSTYTLSRRSKWRHWTRSPRRSSDSARRFHASMPNARSSSASSVNWKRSSVCSRAIARARSQGRRPQPKCRPRERRRLLRRDYAGAGGATAKSAGGSRNSRSLNDQVLALATGKTQQEIAAACKGARPNHVGAAIARHKRAGRVEERDGKLYATQPTGTEQSVAV